MSVYSLFNGISRLLVSVLAFGLGALQGAQWEDQSPQMLLEETVNAIIDILYDDTLDMTNEAKNEKLLQVLDSTFRLDVIIKRALGRNWRKLDQEQQQEFTRLFSKLLVNSYSNRLEGSGERPQFTFNKTIELTKGRLEIQSVVVYNNEAFSVNYRLIMNNEKWELYDIVIEGVSLLTNYRKQFDSILSRQTVRELLDLLSKKIAEF